MRPSLSPHARKPLRLLALGGATLVDTGGAVVAGQRRRLALLVLIAAGRGKGITRDKLVSYLNPESSAESARHALHQLLYYIRQQAGEDVLVGTDPLRLNPNVMTSDAADFEDAFEHGDFSTAVSLYAGPFLDGFHLPDSSAFEEWAAAERARLRALNAEAMVQLASAAESQRDHASAIRWWTKLTALDPVESRPALGLMRAHAAAGDVPAALRHAAIHESVVRGEFGTGPGEAFTALVAELQGRTQTAVEKRDVPSVAPAPSRDVVPVSSTTSPTLHARPRRLTQVTVGVAATLALAAGLFVLVPRTRGTASTAPPAPSDARLVAPTVTERGDGDGTRTGVDEARELYNQGRYVLTQGQFDADVHRRALELFTRALSYDDTFAPAYAGMADVYNHAGEYELAKQAAEHAVALDSTIAEAHTALAYVLAFYEHDWAGADRAVRRAIAIDPRYVLAHLRRANILAAQGLIDSAKAEVEQAHAIEPQSFVVMLNRALVAEMDGQTADAKKHFRSALSLAPGRADAQYMLASVDWAHGDFTEAKSVMMSIGNIAGVTAMSGNPDTMAMLAPKFAASTNLDTIRLAAQRYVRLNNADAAFAQLNRLFEGRDKFLALDLRREPFSSLAPDPRYARLLNRLGLK